MGKRYKNNIGTKILAGTLSVLALGGITAAAVPQSRDYLLDNLAPKSNVYKKLEDENISLKEKISILEGQIEEKKELIAMLNKQIEELRFHHNGYIQEIESLKGQVTIIEVEIENLRQEKLELEQQLENGQSVYDENGFKLVYDGLLFEEIVLNIQTDSDSRSYNVGTFIDTDSPEDWAIPGEVLNMIIDNSCSITVEHARLTGRYNIESSEGTITINFINSNLDVDLGSFQGVNITYDGEELASDFQFSESAGYRYTYERIEDTGTGEWSVHLDVTGLEER